jgi:hypothetical protein
MVLEPADEHTFGPALSRARLALRLAQGGAQLRLGLVPMALPRGRIQETPGRPVAVRTDVEQLRYHLPTARPGAAGPAGAQHTTNEE